MTTAPTAPPLLAVLALLAVALLALPFSHHPTPTTRTGGHMPRHIGNTDKRSAHRRRRRLSNELQEERRAERDDPWRLPPHLRDHPNWRTPKALHGIGTGTNITTDSTAERVNTTTEGDGGTAGREPTPAPHACELPRTPGPEVGQP